MNTTMKHSLRWSMFAVAIMSLGFAAGCKRGNTLDDRTMEDRPHVETEKPVNKDDPFRP